MEFDCNIRTLIKNWIPKLNWLQTMTILKQIFFSRTTLKGIAENVTGKTENIMDKRNKKEK